MLLLHLCFVFPAPKDPDPPDKGQGFFGVQLVDNGGVMITRVEPGSPAEKATLQPNDIILAINDQRVPNVNECRDLIIRLRPGSVVKLEIRRGDNSKIIKLKVGVRPEM